MPNDNPKLTIVTLLEPELCLSCRHAASAIVMMPDLTSRRMLRCRRLDCDNWQIEPGVETPIDVRADIDIKDLGEKMKALT